MAFRGIIRGTTVSTDLTTGTMNTAINHFEIESALQRAGSSWSASQAHGLLCSRLAVMGAEGAADWLTLVLEGADPANEAHQEGAEMLDTLSARTYRQLSERQSEFEPLLPDESEPVPHIAAAMAEWCEGFLHGLVSNVKDDDLKQKLADEPVSDIIRDMLEMTRVAVEDDDPDENEEALTELIEYLRVAGQLVYEVLSEFRHPLALPASSNQNSDDLYTPASKTPNL